ncbi:beta-ketoacyl synthase [Thiomonas sp. FB-6]|uniref:beta-ketoacyl-[acyl-carrier-protein] synthase family protein n=1 Tax=Thiomonas sp. FB-6 TaxID=1158291 RepID=UPI0003796D9C|nr:beta-ketoacyl-[acyl-carrier-protein] synthase family protein [Thiomonas sp. FB-6]
MVTGMGLVSPLGADVAQSFAAALAGRSAVRAMPPRLAAGLAGMLAAPAAVEPATLLDEADAGLDRATQLALAAAAQALAEAGIGPAPDDAERFGVFSGIGFGGACTLDAMYARYFGLLLGDEAERRRATVMHPLTVPRLMANAAQALVSMRYGLRGMGNTYCVACASSAVAAGEALRAIREGYLDAAVVLGSEAMLTPGAMVAWNALRVLARADAADPAASCRPFERRRSGFVLGEAGAALVLESETRAAARGARELAELAGYGASSDAQHLTAPGVPGQVAAMRQALGHAGLAAADIGYVNAHGTATELGDLTETQALAEVFGAQGPAISSTKAVHGHLIGAGGAAELILAIQALRTGRLPPTAHLEQPDPRCGGVDLIALAAREAPGLRAVMSNSFAFGGSNASLIACRAAAADPS